MEAVEVVKESAACVGGPSPHPPPTTKAEVSGSSLLSEAVLGLGRPRLLPSCSSSYSRSLGLSPFSQQVGKEPEDHVTGTHPFSLPSAQTSLYSHAHPTRRRLGSGSPVRVWRV